MGRNGTNWRLSSHIGNVESMPLPNAEDESPDVDDIAHALEVQGEYVIRVNPLPHQRLVDLHWTALRAGKRLGMAVKVFVEGPKHDDDPRLTFTVSPRVHGPLKGSMKPRF